MTFLQRYLMAPAGGLLHGMSRLNQKLQAQYMIRRMKAFGPGSRFDSGCVFTYRTVSIGRNTSLGRNCILQSVHGEIIIGDNVIFGPGVNIHGGNHVTDAVGMLLKDVPKTKGSDGVVRIGNDVWVGANAIILKGVTIGDGAVVAANAVVTHDIPPYTIAAGIPARVRRDRFTPDQLRRHLAALGQ